MDDRARLRLITLALLASSAGCVAALAGRIWRTGTPSFVFLVWNLALAWVPYVCARWAHRQHPESGWPFVAAGAGWLLFLPNAPYLITDLVHIRDQTSFLWWYDTAMILAFAATGGLLGLISMYLMQQVVTARYGWWPGWAMMIIASGLSGLGVWMGRVLRFNSWDVLVHPEAVLRAAASHVVHPIRHFEASFFVAVFAACLLYAYMMFRLGTKLVRSARS